MIALVDYAAGNLKSVSRALDFLKVQNEITDDPVKIEKADAVVIPGVGAAGPAMRALNEKGITAVLQKHCADDKPFFGICLGLQILFERSEEDGSECLGVLAGKVRKLSGKDIKIPHIGWNPVDYETPPQILEGVTSGTPFYFVHSYISEPQDKNVIKATTTHGETFPTVVQKGNTWGVQFHPEKSGKVGLRVLENFVKLI
ncbi:MAG: imidazole glycerol phosphate synthase subunit HisH [Patescibacteria group bacterium]